MASQYSDGMLRRKLEGMGVQVGPITDTTRAVYQRKLRQKQNEEKATTKRPPDPLEYGGPPAKRHIPAVSPVYGEPSAKRHIPAVSPVYGESSAKRHIPADSPVYGEPSAKRHIPAEFLEYGEPPAKKPRRPKPSVMEESPTRTTTQVNVCSPLPRDESSHPPSPPLNSKRKLEFIPNPSPPSPSRQERPSPQSPSWSGGLFSVMTGWIEAGVKKIAHQIQHAASPRPALRRRNPSFRQHKEKVPSAVPTPPSPDSVPMDLIDFGDLGLEVANPSPPPASPPSPRHDTHYDWELLPADVRICKRSDGTLWKLGKGGFGEVYKGMKDGVDEVAVKVIKIQGSQMAIKQFKQEIDMISKLRHRHILQFYGACVNPSCLYMVTELMQMDLFSALKHDARYKWMGEFGRGVAVGIAAGLHYLHSRRPPVVHRDIKSPNVLLMEGTAKIADVGIARTKAASDMTAQRGFTIAWAAPEVVYRKRATEKIDIWSFGIILWEIVTGRPPGPGHLELPLWAPGPLQVLYRRCVEEEPVKRPGAGELVQTLKAME